MLCHTNLIFVIIQVIYSHYSAHRAQTHLAANLINFSLICSHILKKISIPLNILLFFEKKSKKAS